MKRRRVPTQYGKVDFSHLQAWKSIEKYCICKSMGKYLCFQAISPVLFSKIWNSHFLKMNWTYQHSVFHGVWCRQSACAAKMFTTVWKRAGKNELDAVKSMARSLGSNWTHTPMESCFVRLYVWARKTVPIILKENAAISLNCTRQ